MKNSRLAPLEALDKAKQTAEIIEFNHDYDKIVNAETNRISDDFRELLDTAIHSQNLEIRATAGYIALEAATKLTDDPDEKTQLVDFAGHYWGSTVAISKLDEQTNTNALKASIGISVLESASALILGDHLPNKKTRKDMFSRLIGVAEDSLRYGAYLNDQPKDFETFGQAKSLIGLQAELAILLLHQRFTLVAHGIGQLALPSLYSEDHGLHMYENKEKPLAWDISIHQTDEGELSVPIKIQVKSSSGNYHNKPKGYADDIVVVKLAEDIGHTDSGNLLKPFSVLEDIVAEYNLSKSRREPVGDITLCLANGRLATYSDRLLDMIDEEL